MWGTRALRSWKKVENEVMVAKWCRKTNFIWGWTSVSAPILPKPIKRRELPSLMFDDFFLSRYVTWWVLSEPDCQQKKLYSYEIVVGEVNQYCRYSLRILIDYASEIAIVSVNENISKGDLLPSVPLENLWQIIELFYAIYMLNIKFIFRRFLNQMVCKFYIDLEFFERSICLTKKGYSHQSSSHW